MTELLEAVEAANDSGGRRRSCRSGSRDGSTRAVRERIGSRSRRPPFCLHGLAAIASANVFA